MRRRLRHIGRALGFRVILVPLRVQRLARPARGCGFVPAFVGFLIMTFSNLFFKTYQPGESARGPMILERSAVVIVIAGAASAASNASMIAACSSSRGTGGTRPFDCLNTKPPSRARDEAVASGSDGERWPPGDHRREPLLHHLDPAGEPASPRRGRMLGRS